MSPRLLLPASPAAGEGCADLVPYLDADFLDCNPKLFGYGDSVLLRHFLLSAGGLVSYCGYTLLCYPREPSGPFAETLEYCPESVMSGEDLNCGQTSGGAREARAGSRDRLARVARAGSGRCLVGRRAPTRGADSGVRGLSRASLHGRRSIRLRPMAASDPSCLNRSTPRRRAVTMTKSSLARVSAVTGQTLATDGESVLR